MLILVVFKSSLLCRPLDQGLQLRSQVYSVIAGLVWAGIVSDPTFCS